MTDQVPSKELPELLRQFDKEAQGWSEYGCGYGLELLVPAADEIDRLQQCHREGWRYAKEVEDEYERRTGHRFGTSQPPGDG